MPNICAVSEAIERLADNEREALEMVMWDKEDGNWTHTHKDIQAVLAELAGFDRKYQTVRHHRLRDCTCFP